MAGDATFATKFLTASKSLTNHSSSSTLTDPRPQATRIPLQEDDDSNDKDTDEDSELVTVLVQPSSSSFKLRRSVVTTLSPKLASLLSETTDLDKTTDSRVEGARGAASAVVAISAELAEPRDAAVVFDYLGSNPDIT